MKTWVSNIRCRMGDGKTLLLDAFKDDAKCQGVCSECSSFRGINIRLIGERYLHGSCESGMGNKLFVEQ